MHDFTTLDALMAPRSVAVIGASADASRIGGRPIAALLNGGYPGRIMPVNPGRDQIQGLPCYRSVEDLPEIPEAAMIAIASGQAIDAIDALAAKGCRCVTLFSAGFAETGAEGAASEATIRSLIQQHGMRLLGPNTLGVYNVGAHYYGTFSASLEAAAPLPGRIGIASQSGAFGTHLAAVARMRGLGASVLITTGNEVDITVADAIGWMATSDAVDVICTYQEGFRDAGRLIAALEAARQAGKPVFMLKVGRSALGASAAASHTASLTGDDAVAEAVLGDYGAIRVHDAGEMLDFAYAASKRIYPSENTLGVITVSGGAGIIATDEAADAGLPMPPMPAGAQNRLKALLPFGSPVNPLDCTAQAVNDLGLFDAFSRAALEDGGYRSVLWFLSYTVSGTAMAAGLRQTLMTLRAEFPDRILALCIVADAATRRDYDEAGFLVFDDPTRAVRALAAMGRVATILASRTGPKPIVGALQLPPAQPDEHLAKALLAENGIVSAPERMVHDPEDAVAAAEALGFPVVMKIVSPDIVHKSDIGGVRLALSDPISVRHAYGEIMKAVSRNAPEARIAGMLVARQLSGGVECLMGINRDPVFGPVAAFGLGGIFVEILDDVAIRACPFDEAAARAMILSIRAAPILLGARGSKPVDLDALAKMLSSLSLFAAAAGPRLRAIDLNPVLACSDGAYALDAVIELDPEIGS